MAKKEFRSPEQASADPAAIPLLERAEAMGVSTAFSAPTACRPAPSAAAACVVPCALMGPCRLTKDGQVGVCGATLETITAHLRPPRRAGSAAHSDHGRTWPSRCGRRPRASQGLQDRDPSSSRPWPAISAFPPKAALNDIAVDIADNAICPVRPAEGRTGLSSGRPRSATSCGKSWTSPHAASTARWSKSCTARHGRRPGGRAHPDQGHALRLSDGWGGSMLATDISDILFGTPSPLVSQVNLGVLGDDERSTSSSTATNPRWPRCW